MEKRFQTFLANGLKNYDRHSNQPQTDDISYMSPYLHFGQISPLYLALGVMNVDPSLSDARDAFIEQLIIRRELAFNFVYYTPDYDCFDVIPGGPETPWPTMKRIPENISIPGKN